MSDHDDRNARQSAHLARHLNDQHPGTVLLVARHAPGGRPEACRAELTGLDEGGLELTVTASRGTTQLRLALPEGPDVRSRVGALLREIRAGLPDDGSVPLTSLEQQMRSGRNEEHS